MRGKQMFPPFNTTTCPYGQTQRIETELAIVSILSNQSQSDCRNYIGASFLMRI